MIAYTSLIKAVSDSNSWAEYALLKDLKPEERIEKVKELFFIACRKKDDKSALKYYNWFLYAIADTKLLPFVLKAKDKDCEFISETKETYNVEKAISAEQAARTIELYKLLPFVKKDWLDRSIETGETDLIKIDSPVLLETKTAMLEKVAERWRDTDNEQEADKIFNFLWQVETLFEQDRKVKIIAIRKATGLSFSVKRLTRNIISLLNLDSDDKVSFGEKEKIAKVLTIARSRNKDVKEILNELKIMQYMEGCSDGGYRYLEKIAEKISGFDAETKELIRMMKSRGHGYAVQGEIHLSYTDFMVLIVEIEIRLVSIDRNIPEEDLHQQFELARNYILQWQHKYPHRRVRLVLKLKDERIKFGNEQPQKFLREQTF